MKMRITPYPSYILTSTINAALKTLLHFALQTPTASYTLRASAFLRPKLQTCSFTSNRHFPFC